MKRFVLIVFAIGFVSSCGSPEFEPHEGTGEFVIKDSDWELTMTQCSIHKEGDEPLEAYARGVVDADGASEASEVKYRHGEIL